MLFVGFFFFFFFFSFNKYRKKRENVYHSGQKQIGFCIIIPLIFYLLLFLLYFLTFQNLCFLE